MRDGALRRTTLVPVILGAAWLSPTIARAQQPVPLAGRYTACFRAADSTRPACGTVTLAPTAFCGTTHDGYYSVLFDALELGDSLGSRPENEARFTWTVSPEGGIQLSHKTFVTDSLPGHMRCVLSNVSRFEAWGRVAGDSIGGAWGRYDHDAGMDTLGTFVMRRRQQ